MPKKSSKDGSDTKKRRGSSKDSRAASGSTEEVLMPPTPKAKHLFASNPFDDPPPSNMVGPGPNYLHGSPRMMHPSMHMPNMSPGYMAKGPYNPPGWKPNPVMHPPVGPGPGWQQGHGEPMPPMGQGYPCPGPPMDYSRMPMHNQPGPMKHSPYGVPMPGLDIPRDGPPFEHMHPDPNHMNIPASMGHPTGGMYQKVMARKPEKPRKNETSGWGSKTKKPKAESNPVVKPTETRTESWPANQEKASPNVTKNTPPHATLPTLPQTCVKCSKELEEPLDETVCCLASCHGWYHRACTGLTKAALECLCAEELALWACDRCLGTMEIMSVRLRKSGQPADGHAPPAVSVKS